MEPSFTIAVAGPSGAGKTTLVNELARRLDLASAFFYDDYPKTFGFDGSMVEWLKEGGDSNVWSTPQLVEHLAELRAGRSVQGLQGDSTVKPTSFIVVEEPFGRSRDEFAVVSDFSICIDLPMAVSLARLLLREMPLYLNLAGPEGMESYVREYLTWYLSEGWILYPMVNEHAKRRADCILDGMLGPEDLADAAEAAVRAHRSRLYAERVP